MAAQWWENDPAATPAATTDWWATDAVEGAEPTDQDLTDPRGAVDVALDQNPLIKAGRAIDLGPSLALGGAGLVRMFGSVAGILTGQPDNVTTRLGDDWIKRAQEAKSPELRALEEERTARIEGVEGEGFGPEARRAGIAIWDTVTSPRLLASFAAEQVPQFALIGPAARIGGIVAGQAGKAAAAKSGATLMEQRAAEMLAKEAGAVAGGAASEMGLQGADTAMQTQQQLFAIPDVVWRENPTIRAQMDEFDQANPMAPLEEREAHYTELKNETIANLSGKAFTAAALIALSTMAIPGATTIERKLGGVAGTGVGSRLKRGIVAGVGESLQQGIPEGPGGALIANLETQPIDPSHPTGRGVGEQFGMGALFGIPGAAVALTETPLIPEQAKPSPINQQMADLLKSIGDAPTDEDALQAAQDAIEAARQEQMRRQVDAAQAPVPPEKTDEWSALEALVFGRPGATSTDAMGQSIQTPGVIPGPLADEEREQVVGRYGEIIRKAFGQPGRTSVDEQGNAVTEPPIRPQPLTADEHAERRRLEAIIAAHERHAATTAQRDAQVAATVDSAIAASAPAAGPQATTHDYASTQVVLPEAAAQATKRAAVEQIDPADVHPEEGLEDNPHITVLYGLHEEVTPDAVKEVLADAGPVTATVTGIEIFEPEGKDYDVVVARVDSPELAALNEKLKALPNSTTFPDYKPHVTLGYVKKGAGQKYLGIQTGLEGQELTFDALELMGTDETVTPIPLKAPATKPAETQGVDREPTVSVMKHAQELIGTEALQERIRLKLEDMGELSTEEEAAEIEGVGREVVDEGTPPHAAVVDYVSPRERTLTPEEARTRDIAIALRDGQPEAVQVAAAAMAPKVQKGATLVPIPSSDGTTTANRALAEAIAEITGAKVADVLRREGPVESSADRRRAGQPGLKAEEHGIVAKGPVAGNVQFIDNVLTTGATGDAARQALGKGSVLAYAKANEVTTLKTAQEAPGATIEAPPAPAQPSEPVAAPAAAAEAAEPDSLETSDGGRIRRVIPGLIPDPARLREAYTAADGRSLNEYLGKLAQFLPTNKTLKAEGRRQFRLYGYDFITPPGIADIKDARDWVASTVQQQVMAKDERYADLVDKVNRLGGFAPIGQAPQTSAPAAAEPKRSAFPDIEAAAIKRIHAAADAKGIPWDNDEAFMNVTALLTGKRHLDDMTPEQLTKVEEWIQAQPEAAARPAGQAAALDAIEFGEMRRLDKTGEIVQITQSAEVRVRRAVKRLKVLSSLRDCVRA